MTRPLTRHLAAELRRAVNATGTYDPRIALVVIEEWLTAEELEDAEAFLKWIYQRGLTFGHNIFEVWETWQRLT